MKLRRISSARSLTRPVSRPDDCVERQQDEDPGKKPQPNILGLAEESRSTPENRGTANPERGTARYLATFWSAVIRPRLVIRRSTSPVELYTWGVTRAELPRTLTKILSPARRFVKSGGIPDFLLRHR